MNSQCVRPTFPCKTLQGGSGQRGERHQQRRPHDLINVMTRTHETTATLAQNLGYLTIQAAARHNPVVKPGTAANIVSVSIQDCQLLIVDNLDSDQTVAQYDN